MELKGSLLKTVKRKSVAKLDTEIEVNVDMGYTANPLRQASENKDDTSNEETQTRSVYALEMENTDLKTTNIELETENTVLEHGNAVLQRRITELETKEVEDDI